MKTGLLWPHQPKKQGAFMRNAKAMVEEMHEQHWCCGYRRRLLRLLDILFMTSCAPWGVVFISEGTPRVVQIGQTIYQEGGMDAVVDRMNDDLAEAIGKGRPNKTTRLQ